MRGVGCFVFVSVCMMAADQAALGQELPRAPGAPVRERGYIAAQAGAVSGPPTAVVFSVEYGERVHSDVQAYATLSYVENLMRRELRDDVRNLAALLSVVTNDPWDLRGRDRGVVLTAGGKYLVGDEVVRPYVGAGAGIMNLKRTIVEAHLGNVTTAVFNDFNVGDGLLSLSASSVTTPLVEAIAGVAIGAGHTHVDVGYRYRRAFRLADRLDFSQLSVGIGYRF